MTGAKQGCFLWLNLAALCLLLAGCGKAPAPPAPVSGDPHAAEQARMAAGTLDFSNVMVIRLQSEGQRVEVTSVLPAIVAEATLAGQSAQTIFRVNEKGSGLVLFSRDLPHGKSFRVELTLPDLEQKKSFSFPVVQPDASLKERAFALEKIIRQP
jgi:hypothetical protein